MNSIPLANFLTHLTSSDKISRIPLVTTVLAEAPCSDVVGFVIYDLPGRDCAAKASNGELATGQLSTYESQYIDRRSSLNY